MMPTFGAFGTRWSRLQTARLPAARWRASTCAAALRDDGRRAPSCERDRTAGSATSCRTWPTLTSVHGRRKRSYTPRVCPPRSVGASPTRRKEDPVKLAATLGAMLLLALAPPAFAIDEGVPDRDRHPERRASRLRPRRRGADARLAPLHRLRAVRPPVPHRGPLHRRDAAGRRVGGHAEPGSPAARSTSRACSPTTSRIRWPCRRRAAVSRSCTRTSTPSASRTTSRWCGSPRAASRA